MVDMEEAQLIFLFPQNEEKCIAEFQKLAKVVPPNCVSNLNAENIEFSKGFSHIAPFHTCDCFPFHLYNTDKIYLNVENFHIEISCRKFEKMWDRFYQKSSYIGR